ncbi:MAG: diguanylate cyclase [Deltaproteobacteria bacterium]|nr:diguanylate cyclase [Deltaproteobacteria bacterium]
MSGRGDTLKRFRYAAGLSAPLYLLALSLLRERIPGGLPFLLFVATGPLAASIFFVTYLLARKRDDRIPDLLPLLVWGSAVAMEIHAFVPSVARTGVVPAALFFGLALKFPPALSIPAILCVDAWLAAVPGPIEQEIFYTSAMALIAGGAGIGVRKRYRSAGLEVKGVQEAIARSRTLILPWEDSGNNGLPAGGEMTEESSLLRREEEMKEGIREALDRLLGVTGASHVAYVSRSVSPGSVLYDGILLSRGSPVSREIFLPDTYVPVREATVFRKPFLEVGAGARRYAPWKSGPGSAPAGVAAVPVYREGVVEGVLLAVRDEEGPWRDPVIPAMELAGHFVGRDIDRMRELHQGDRYYLRGKWYHSMVRKMAEVGSEGDPEAGGGGPSNRERVYAETAEQVLRQVDADRVLLVESGEDPGKGRVVWAQLPNGGGPGQEGYESFGDSYVGWVIRNGTQRIFPGASAPPGTQGVLPGAWEREGERSFLVLPVKGKVGFRGALVCAHPQEKRFRKEHAEIAREITTVMQLGLSHVERIESLTKKATTDGLTGLSNRKAFLERLTVDLARLDGRHPCGVVMLDIDHFKRVNDTYGHPFGDEVLRGVASVLRKGVRKGDTAGRYGGEEFVLFLHMADTERAREGAERFRRMIRQIRFAHAGKEIAVTASFGVACAPHHGKGVEELLKHADEALYLSKQYGRDRVTVYPG